MFTAGMKAERRRYCQVLKEVAAAWIVIARTGQ